MVSQSGGLLSIPHGVYGEIIGVFMVRYAVILVSQVTSLMLREW
jgi:hypothetical protein